MPGPFRVDVVQRDHFRFDVTFENDSWAPIVVDEPEPLGTDAGPNAARLLAGAVGNCLAASLLFALRKFKNEPGRLRVSARTTLARNEDRRWRVQRVQVDLQLSDAADTFEHLDRILEQFEDFCIVTQSVREGIEVDVRVHDGEGRELR